VSDHGSNDYLDFDIPDIAVPAGMHPVVVNTSEIKEGPKARYVRLQMEVTGGDAKGEYLWYNITLSDKPFARRRAKRDLESLLGRELGKRENIAQIVTELGGKMATALVEMGEYQGEPRPQVQRLLPPREGSLAVTDDDEIPF